MVRFIAQCRMNPTATQEEIATPVFDRLAMTENKTILEKLNYYLFFGGILDEQKCCKSSENGVK